MNLIFTIVFAFGIGYAVKQRWTAVILYLALDAILFSYQTVGVLLSWMADRPPIAFGPAPSRFPIEYDQSEVWGYGAVNLVIIAAGVGLVVLGNRVAARRASRRASVAVS